MNNKINRKSSDGTMTIFGKTYTMESVNEFVKMFWKWQKRFMCPKCKTPTMDFILKESINEPLICTNCLTHFDFKEIKA